jgi:hypothetical protein
MIERAVLLRDDERVPVRQDHHVREKADPLGRPADERERAAGVVPGGAHRRRA